MKQSYIQINSVPPEFDAGKYAVALKTYRRLTNAGLIDATNVLEGFDQSRRAIVPTDRPLSRAGEVQTLRDIGFDVEFTEDPCNMQTLITLQQNALNAGDLTLVRILSKAVYDVTEHLEGLE